MPGGGFPWVEAHPSLLAVCRAVVGQKQTKKLNSVKELPVSVRFLNHVGFLHPRSCSVWGVPDGQQHSVLAVSLPSSGYYVC